METLTFKQDVILPLLQTMDPLTFEQDVILALLLNRYDANSSKLMAVRYIIDNFRSWDKSRSRYKTKDIIIAYNRAYCNK